MFVSSIRYQSALSGEKVDSSSSDEEENGELDKKQDKNADEKIVFSGMSTLKSQWEHGAINSAINSSKDHEDEKKEELENLRQKVCSGRSESLKQVFERASKESTGEVIRSETVILDTSIKTETIKEKFEKGNLENDDERSLMLKKEREEELSIFKNESETTSKEARNRFKQIDASAKEPISPPPTQLKISSFKNQQINGSLKSPTKSSAQAISEVVKCSDPISKDEIIVETNQIHDRFSYFENYKEAPKEPKRHQITPPRDPKSVVENKVEDNRDSSIVRSIDVVDDLPKDDIAKKMLNKFKALENNQIDKPAGPKPMKRITPPKEYTTDNDPDKRDPSPERDPNISNYN